MRRSAVTCTRMEPIVNNLSGVAFFAATGTSCCAFRISTQKLRPEEQVQRRRSRENRSERQSGQDRRNEQRRTEKRWEIRSGDGDRDASTIIQRLSRNFSQRGAEIGPRRQLLQRPHGGHSSPLQEPLPHPHPDLLIDTVQDLRGGETITRRARVANGREPRNEIEEEKTAKPQAGERDRDHMGKDMAGRRKAQEGPRARRKERSVPSLRAHRRRWQAQRRQRRTRR